MMRLCLLLLCAGLCWGGQSIVLTPGNHSTWVNVQPLPASTSFRIEFQMHDWQLPVTQTNVWDMNDVGISAVLLPYPALRIIDKRDTPTASGLCDLSLAGIPNALVKIQRDAINMVVQAEVWNWNGDGYNSCSIPLAALGDWPYPGGQFGDLYTQASIGFYKVFSTLVPLGGMPPVTATKTESGCTFCTNLSFDGVLTDSSGNGHDVSWGVLNPVRFIRAAFAQAAPAAPSLQQGTTVSASQIRNWRQVSPLEIGGPDVSGTRLLLTQTDVDPDRIASWLEIVTSVPTFGGGDSYGVSLDDASSAVLLCCGGPGYDPSGWGQLWFTR